MNMTELRLDIDDSRYITLEFLGTVKDLYLFDEITITYHHKRKKFILYTKDFVARSLGAFAYELEMALNNRLILHSSIKHDLGFLWNEYLQEKGCYDFYEIPLEKSTCWVGLNYHCFSSHKYDTWLYNKNNDVYLEITPCYKWHHIKGLSLN